MVIDHQFPRALKLNEEPAANCENAEEVYDEKCGYDLTGKILSHLYTNATSNSISALEPMDNEWRSKGILRVFEQREFIDYRLFKNPYMKREGFYFYPFACLEEGAKCKLHISFHGC